MITKEFNSKEYQIPESWQDVTIGMIVKEDEILEILEDAPFIAKMHAYTGIPLNELRRKGDNDKQLQEALEITNILTFASNPYEPQPRIGFDYNGSHYDCPTDMFEQSFEDFVSIQTVIGNYKAEPHRALPKLVAIMCKKADESLEDFNLGDRAKEFENLSITIAFDVQAFFLHSISVYKSNSLLSSTADIQKDIVLQKLKDLQNTVKQSRMPHGMFSPTNWLLGISQLYLKLWQRDLEKYYNSQPTENSKKTLTMICKKLLMKKAVKQEIK